jgi:hypothetical protein
MISTQSDSIGFLFSMSGLTLIILFMVLTICGWLAVSIETLKVLSFKYPVFIMIYILGEIIEDYKILSLSTLPYIGSEIKVISAVFLDRILWLRLYSVKNSGREMIDKLESEEDGGNLNGANENT